MISLIVVSHFTPHFRSNILLEKENGKLNAIICDFGLARVKESKVKRFPFYFLSFIIFTLLSFMFLTIQLIFLIVGSNPKDN